MVPTDTHGSDRVFPEVRAAVARHGAHAQGSAVEVEADGEWWDAHVVECRHGGAVRVHYVGGTDDQAPHTHAHARTRARAHARAQTCT